MPTPVEVAELPRSLFSGVASTYDWPAQVLSLFQYRRWHRFLLSRLNLPQMSEIARPEPIQGPTVIRVLDMATGTGALALTLARRPGLRIIAADITRPMLLQAKARAARLRPPSSIDFIECTAEAVPLSEAAFDAVIFTYLLRYVADVPATLRQLARLLPPGGMMLSLDFAVPRGLAYPIWRLHTGFVLPLGGALLSPAWRRVGAFLGPSIRRFYQRWPEPRLLQLWQECGFPDVQAQRLSLGGALVMWGTKAS